jgi:hypothetical protein
LLGAPRGGNESGRLVVALIGACALLLVLAPAAFAAKGLVSSFGATGTTGGAFSATTGVGGVAVNNSTGDVYAVDRGNHRIQQFTASGSFIRAWGQDVDTAAGTGFEICTVAANCKAGINSASTGGAMSTPQGVAIDPASGNVYVTDQAFLRVDVFSSTGTFLRSFGQDVVSSGPGNNPAAAAKQTLTVDATGGTFTLSFRGKTTAALPWNVSAAELKAALEALSTIGPLSVSTSGGPGATAALVITFAGGMGNAPLPAITPNPSGLSGGGESAGVAITTPGSSGFEICVAANGDVCKTGVTGGTAGAFASTFGGYPAINPNNSNVVVADPANRRGQVFTSGGTFIRAFGADVVANGPSNGGGADEVQQIKVGASSGTFTLTFSAQTTPALPYSASASQVEAALNGLSTIGGVAGRVTVTGGPGDPTGSSPYVITFGGSLAGTNVAQITINSSGLGVAVETELSCTGGPETATLTYQWLRNGAAISGASSTAYTTVADDAGAVIQCEATGLIVGTGSKQVSGATVVSPAPGTAPPVAPVSIAAPTITSGSLSVGGPGGAVLTCVPGSWAGSPSFAYRWSLNGAPIAGATAATYVVQEADLASAGNFQCAVLGTNGGGTVALVSANRVTTPSPVPGAPVLTASVPSPGVASTATEGVPGYEVCAASAMDVCKVGVAGTGIGMFANTSPNRVAVDSAGSIYATDANNFRVQKFTSSASAAAVFAPSILTGTGSSSAPSELAVDPVSDNVYVAKAYTSPTERRILQFDNAGNLVDTHLSGALATSINGLAAASSSAPAGAGNLYVTTAAGVGAVQQVLVLNTPVPPVATTDPGAGFAVTATGVTATGSVNPKSFTTTWRFEYSTDGSTWTKAPAPDATLGFADGIAHAVSQAIPDLMPNTTYRVRLVATKPFGGGSSTSPETTFKTATQAPIISGTGVDSIQNTSVRLVGFVNPRSQEATYHFEYGTAGDCETNACQSVPVPEASAGSGFTPLFVIQPVDGLQPATTYHYRLVASNSTGATKGPDQTFTTRALPLPVAGRAYELVSPANKPGGVGVGVYSSAIDGDNGVRTGTASSDGERFISPSVAGHLTEGGFLYVTDYAFSDRTDEGWISHTAYTRKDYSARGGTAVNFDPETATDDLSQIGFRSNGAFLFPSMSNWSNGLLPSYISDWNGKWETMAPVIPTGGSPNVLVQAAAAKRTLVGGSELRGMLGPEDPTSDQPTGVSGGSATYLHVAPATGPSDTLPGGGAKVLIGACTGSGAARTEIPQRSEAGKQGAQECPAPSPGRNQRLVSLKGASVDHANTLNNTTRDAISDDGRRVFFNSPDPMASGSPTTCSGTGPATECPSQVYVWQEGEGGEPTVRWVSRSTVADQDASLMAKVYYEGASRTGDRVFFRTNAPLTSDDPNGTGSAPVTTGTPSATSWDLYEYEVPSGADGRPGAPDPGAGTLRRVSAGPLGTGDGNVSVGGTAGSLRAVSADGTKLFFTSQVPLPGVATNANPTNGTSTVASGAAAETASTNLYYYDSAKPLADRWEFVARLPRGNPIGQCATVAVLPGQSRQLTGNGKQYSTSMSVNCFHVTDDGEFATFWTHGKLVANDPDEVSGDMYAFDAVKDRLVRISQPHGGKGIAYGCVGLDVKNPTNYCYGDGGFYGSFQDLSGLATDPDDPSVHMAYFQSKSQLVPEDTNDHFDVYEWRDGKLSLVSTGTAATGAFFSGNSADGRDVFFETRSKLSWQDFDGVMDVYDARSGGGIPEPPPGTPGCNPLAEQCQGPPIAPPPPPPTGTSTYAGPGNESPGKPKKQPKPKKSKKKSSKKNRGKKQKHKQKKQQRSGGNHTSGKGR